MTNEQPPPVSDAIWRNRFLTLNLVRIGGTILTLIGIVIWQGNLVRQGGSAAIGLPLAIAGLLISFIGAKRLRARWKTPPSQ
jgi:hypothetical protein